MEDWASGMFLLETLEKTGVQNAVALGKADILRQLISIQPKDLEQ